MCQVVSKNRCYLRKVHCSTSGRSATWVMPKKKASKVKTLSQVREATLADVKRAKGEPRPAASFWKHS